MWVQEENLDIDDCRHRATATTSEEEKDETSATRAGDIPLAEHSGRFFRMNARRSARASHARVCPSARGNSRLSPLMRTSSKSSSNDFVVEDHEAGLLCSSVTPSATLPAAAASHSPSVRLASVESHTDTLYAQYWVAREMCRIFVDLKWHRSGWKRGAPPSQRPPC